LSTVSATLPHSSGVGELLQPAGGFLGGGAGQVGVRVRVGHGQQVLAAGEGLFALDLGAEPRVGGAGIAFEHLDAQVPVGDRTSDRAAGAAGDEPGQGAAELASRQPPELAIDLGNAVLAAVRSAVVVNPVTNSLS
jgi:hypothetical protein